MKQLNYISHIQSPLSTKDCDLFIKAVSTKGKEATAFIWLQWYFDFKNDPKNIITEEQKEKMIEAYEKNRYRIFKALNK